MNIHNRYQWKLYIACICARYALLLPCLASHISQMSRVEEDVEAAAVADPLPAAAAAVAARTLSSPLEIA